MTDIGTMNSIALAAYITALDESHKLRMKTLRALQRAKAAEEAANGEPGNPTE